jgi:hypothetical protein
MIQPLSTLARGVQIMCAKHTILREDSPFELDLEMCESSDYDAILPWLHDIEERLKKTPVNAQGMRWIHCGNTVLFHGQRVIRVPYDSFVSRVDITNVAPFYRDCLSATKSVAEYDECGRHLRQGVRIVALPQPNYAAFFGKPNLDVYKLQTIAYSEDEQRVWMVTVHSPNKSAVCDDGYLSFSRAPDDIGTVVTMLGCQNFPVPPLMAATGLHRWTWFKNLLVENAYRRFFNVMITNIRDCYDGNEFRIGRPAKTPKASALRSTPSARTARSGTP